MRLYSLADIHVLRENQNVKIVHYKKNVPITRHIFLRESIIVRYLLYLHWHY
jgi:hypothetical protein